MVLYKAARLLLSSRRGIEGARPQREGSERRMERRCNIGNVAGDRHISETEFLCGTSRWSEPGKTAYCKLAQNECRQCQRRGDRGLMTVLAVCSSFATKLDQSIREKSQQSTDTQLTNPLHLADNAKRVSLRREDIVEECTPPWLARIAGATSPNVIQGLTSCKQTWDE